MKKNITVAVALDTYYRSRIWAAQHNTTVSCMVGKFLRKMAEAPEPSQVSPKTL